MSAKVEIFHFDDIANSYHGESLYCGLSSSLSLQVDKDCTITVFGQIKGHDRISDSELYSGR